MVVLEQALAYVCCSAEEGKTKVQRYCRKIYELGYVPICPQYSFSPFLDDGDAEDMQAMRRMSHQILRRCRMVVVCGKETTGTMNTEISMADRLYIFLNDSRSLVCPIAAILQSCESSGGFKIFCSIARRTDSSAFFSCLERDWCLDAISCRCL